MLPTPNHPPPPRCATIPVAHPHTHTGDWLIIDRCLINNQVHCTKLYTLHVHKTKTETHIYTCCYKSTQERIEKKNTHTHLNRVKSSFTTYTTLRAGWEIVYFLHGFSILTLPLPIILPQRLPLLHSHICYWFLHHYHHHHHPLGATTRRRWSFFLHFGVYLIGWSGFFFSVFFPVFQLIVGLSRTGFNFSSGVFFVVVLVGKPSADCLVK